MKKYNMLGDLLLDYRELKKLSQHDFAALIDVDVRSVIRWEKNETLIKSDKEKDLAEATFIPYQVIRNLNAAVPIPIFFDFRIRKYSYSKLTIELPEASWFLTQLNIVTKRTRVISTESDLADIIKYTNFLYLPEKPISQQLILEAAKLLPELNQVILDTLGHYAGHCVTVPIDVQTFEKLKNKEITEYDLTVSNLVDPKLNTEVVYWGYDYTADCNENIFFALCPAFKYFLELESDNYIFAVITVREDNFKLITQFGLDLVWEDIERQKEAGFKSPPRFYEGNFIEFFKQI